MLLCSGGSRATEEASSWTACVLLAGDASAPADSRSTGSIRSVLERGESLGVAGAGVKGARPWRGRGRLRTAIVSDAPNAEMARVYCG